MISNPIASVRQLTHQRHILLRTFVDTVDYGIELLKARVDPEGPPCWQPFAWPKSELKLYYRLSCVGKQVDLTESLSFPTSPNTLLQLAPKPRQNPATINCTYLCTIPESLDLLHFKLIGFKNFFFLSQNIKIISNISTLPLQCLQLCHLRRLRVLTSRQAYTGCLYL